jgi:CRISPR-associated protein Cmr5
MNSGLGQALAFLLAKDECPDLIRAINHWVLFKQDYPRDIASLPRPNLLLERVINGTSDELRWMTAEALSYLQWLVRFAEAEGLTDNSGD